MYMIKYLWNLLIESILKIITELYQTFDQFQRMNVHLKHQSFSPITALIFHPSNCWIHSQKELEVCLTSQKDFPPPKTQLLSFREFLLQSFSHWLQTMDFQLVSLIIGSQHVFFRSMPQNSIDFSYSIIFHGSCFCSLNSVSSVNENGHFLP